MRYILYGLLVYFLIRLVFNFIIPVYKTTKQVKKQFNDLNERMNAQGQNDQPPGSDPSGSDIHSHVGEYIDFEEVK